ncbi:hypothetical protein QUF72_16070 [Desulfobacterales bacterium HSG2]|nr:hypothetical protein [Desulfobacterales bacterium HSG2]
MLRKCLISLLVVLFPAVSYADLTHDNAEKREKVRYAIKKGILSHYDIPFETYIKLEMWDEIEFIFEANNKNMIKYEFPNSYYSRPYIVNHQVWVFENSAGSDKGIYVFDSDTLKLLKKLNNKAYAKYDGGIRKIFNNTIISGGSDEDVDTAVIWNTDTDEIRTVRLQDGHYIGAVEVQDGRIYIGSCGGVINSWSYGDYEFSGIYSSSDKENINWRVFNEKECITRIRVVRDRLIGVGEKTVFIWDVETRELTETYSKVLNNSIIFFYKNYMIEYKNDKLVIRDLEDGRVVRKAKAEKSVEDLIVTSEEILGNHKGELLIVALRHNKGLLFYDFNTLKLLKKINTDGETLTAYNHTIFVTDDRNLYKYDIVHKDTERYEAFLEKISPDNMSLNIRTYFQLVRRLRDYPEFIKKIDISGKILKLYKLGIRHSFKYGKIGERFVSKGENTENEGYIEDVYGYKALYEMRNHSENYYFITIASSWSGEYGRSFPHNNGAWEVEDTTKRGYTEHSFFILPYGGKYKGHFEVGEKEPVNLLICPKQIEKVSEEYYNGFVKALSHKNKDVSLIDKYLDDNLVKNWHDLLKERKKRLVGDGKETFNIFKIFE